MDPYQISVSARQLVEYAYLSGDIEAGFQTAEALQEGVKVHRQVQREYGELDRKEVYLKADIAFDDLLFAVDGRCDGLLATEPLPTIDEIKSAAGRFEEMREEGLPVHWAQATVYAYLYARENGCPAMRLQLTYVHRDTGETARLQRELSMSELEKEMYGYLERYAPYARMLRDHERERDASIRELAFPYPAYRPGQKKLAGAVYKCFEEGVSLYALAPTGLGKTVSTAFPAVKAIGSGVLKRFYYITARTTTRTAAEEALKLMASQGLKLHAVTVTAKEKICFQEQTVCRKEHCPYADGYYDRINEAILDMLGSETLMTREVIESYARKHTVCPFELSLDAAYASDAVICDYNYVFDPRISFKRLTAEAKKRTAVLADEAHNLPDRARDMFSAELTKSPFLALQREYKGRNRELHAAAKALNDYFIALRKRCGQDGVLVERELPAELATLAAAFAKAAEKELLAGESAAARQMAFGGEAEEERMTRERGSPEDGPAEAGMPSGVQRSESVREAYFAALRFARCAELFDERFAALAEASSREVRLKLFCLDPSALLRQTAAGYRSFVYFSATLSPLNYYMDVTGADETDYTLSLPSPFAEEQLEVSVAPLSTRYRDRTESCGPIARLILRQTERHTGNYMAFFPSYVYMNAVAEMFIGWKKPDTKVLLQRPDMSEEERTAFLGAFQPAAGRTLIGFAVMGGVFSEGVDLPGDRLTGVVIVGVGMPQPDLERNLLRDYYADQGRSGFDYAYVIPGMNKVLQAGGRLIRTETDRGSLLLIDDRYLQPGFRRLLPKEWLASGKNDFKPFSG